VTTIAISTTIVDGGEYARAIAGAGGEPRLLRFDLASLDEQLAGCAGVLLSGGGDVDPQRYGGAPEDADEIDGVRDAFELALVRRAREQQLPTLCICRGLQLANVAFAGSLVGDLGARFGSQTATLHRRLVDGESERGLIDGHVVHIERPSRLAEIVGDTAVVTGSRHHQSLDRVAADLNVVATTPDGIVEAAEARFASPFWLGVQWHPESTIDRDSGASRKIFAAFVGAAAAFVG
jgi:putative glutamine amidotransferase